MRWNWEQPDWPRFQWRPECLGNAEERFLRGAGVLVGVSPHLGKETRAQISLREMSEEALTTSAIEGEHLDRASVQSSVQRELGLKADERRLRARPKEQGIAELMVDLYRTAGKPLGRPALFGWHRQVMAGSAEVRDVGRYRPNPEPMQVISGPYGRRKVHFEAPPSTRVPAEMAAFVRWFNRTAPDGPAPLPALARAGVAHLYFECIHPFEDGNGRIGRAVAEKALAQAFGQPAMVGLSQAVYAHRRAYYDALEAANKRIEVTGWLTWFAAIALEAQARTLAHIEFMLAKTRLLDGLRGRLNPRQEKAVLRMLREGPDGFEGAMSAGKYAAITDAAPATATRDLQELVQLGALLRTGERKHTRYALNLPAPEFQLPA